MRLIKLPKGKHQCLIYATAMLLDVEPSEIIEILGHDGIDIWWPELAVPNCFRGVHIQEILDVCAHFGYGLICYQVMPRTSPFGRVDMVRNIFEVDKALERIDRYLKEPGLIVTDVHACAWDGESVYDPNGMITSIQSVALKEFYLLKRI